MDISRDWLADQFQAYRPQLHALAYRMLGSLRDADDAIQETWLRLDRSDAAAINDLRTWLSTVAGRVCLDMLRSRKASREHYTGTWLPEPQLHTEAPDGPEQQAPVPDPDLRRQRQVVDAFLAAARNGDFAALLAVLDPDVVFRADIGPDEPRRPRLGAHRVARHVLATAPQFAGLASPIIINGAAGAAFGDPAHPIAVIAFTITNGRIAVIDLIADPDKLSSIRLQRGRTAAMKQRGSIHPGLYRPPPGSHAGRNAVVPDGRQRVRVSEHR
jgi:RNA polymerase sigma factor (sigma-70 family)